MIDIVKTYDQGVIDHSRVTVHQVRLKNRTGPCNSATDESISDKGDDPMIVVMEPNSINYQAYSHQDLWYNHERQPHFWLEDSLVALRPEPSKPVIGLAAYQSPQDRANRGRQEGQALRGAGEIVWRGSRVQGDSLGDNHQACKRQSNRSKEEENGRAHQVTCRAKATTPHETIKKFNIAQGR